MQLQLHKYAAEQCIQLWKSSLWYIPIYDKSYINYIHYTLMSGCYTKKSGNHHGDIYKEMVLAVLHWLCRPMRWLNLLSTAQLRPPPYLGLHGYHTNSNITNSNSRNERDSLINIKYDRQWINNVENKKWNRVSKLQSSCKLDK